MAETYGWAGKILRVNLTTGEITTQDDAKYHKYIGGMGMAYRIMYEEAPMELDPYDEKALVIFGVGPLTGAGVPCSGRMNVTFRSTWSKGQLHHRRPHGRPHRLHAEVCRLRRHRRQRHLRKARLPAHRGRRGLSGGRKLRSGARVPLLPTSGWWSRTAVSSRPLPSALPVRIWWTTPP